MDFMAICAFAALTLFVFNIFISFLEAMLEFLKDIIGPSLLIVIMLIIMSVLSNGC